MSYRVRITNAEIENRWVEQRGSLLSCFYWLWKTRAYWR